MVVGRLNLSPDQAECPSVHDPLASIISMTPAKGSKPTGILGAANATREPTVRRTRTGVNVLDLCK